jgi:peptide/nickel transport system substrate-binding protein
MKRISFKRLTRSSFAVALLLAATATLAARRPRYGGTLNVELAGRVTSLDPAQQPTGREDQIAQERLLELIADRLVTLDSSGQPQPSLAISWQHDAAFKHWEFHLRPNVRYQDATPFTPDTVATSLRTMNPTWHVSSAGDAVIFDLDLPAPDLPNILAEPRNSILLRKTFGAVVGTGPFRISDWEPGTHAVLVANDGYWEGRPFLGSVDVRMGESAKQSAIDLDLGKADVAALAPESARLEAARGVRISASEPSELLAIVFAPSSAATTEIGLRRALSLAIDRDSLVNFVLQKEGEPAGALLPQWSSGYAFLFPVQADPATAQQLVSQISPAPTLKLGYDSTDSLERMIAERIVVNAQSAGLLISAIPISGAEPSGPAVDARLIRLRMASPAPGVALADFLQRIGGHTSLDPSLTAPLEDASDAGALYARERAVIETDEIIPLMHVPEVVALSSRVRDWMPSRRGEWRLADVWLDEAAP